MQKFRVLLVGFMLLVLAAGSANAQWTALSGYAGNNYGFAAQGTNMFVGTDDYVYISANGGSWVHPVLANLTSGVIRALAVEGGNLIVGADYVGGIGGGIFTSADAGDTWGAATGLPNAGGVKVIAMLVNGTDIYAGVYTYGIYKSTDHGASWSIASAGLGANKIASLILAGSTMYAGTISDGIFSSTDGSTWTAVANNPTDPNIRSLAYISPFLFAGTPSGLFRTNDAGATASWVDKTAGLTNSYPYSLAVSSTNLIAGTAGGGICVSQTSGDTWNNVNTASVTDATVVQALFINSGTLYAATTTGAYSRALSEALPVELTSFTASVSGANVELRWKTATETNNYGFEIQRKRAADASWSKVGFVNGAGTTNAPQAYAYSDKGGAQYAYRLKQIDRDGKFQYSQTIETTGGQSASTFDLAQNYPNPFNPTTNIAFSVPSKGYASLKIFNTLGQVVATLFEGNVESGFTQNVVFDASKLSSGVYFSRLEFNGQQTMKKIMLMK